MFRKKPYELSLGRVHDTVRVREGDATITLEVEADPARMVAALNDAQKYLKTIGDASTDAEKRDVAKVFAAAVFGDEQAEKLLAFYHGDAACVINICGRYFSERLAKLITKAQKKS